MSRIREAVGRIKQAGFDIGLAKLAEEAGIAKSTARDLLKEDHRAMKNLLALEAAAEKHLEPPAPQA